MLEWAVANHYPRMCGRIGMRERLGLLAFGHRVFVVRLVCAGYVFWQIAAGRVCVWRHGLCDSTWWEQGKIEQTSTIGMGTTRRYNQGGNEITPAPRLCHYGTASLGQMHAGQAYRSWDVSA